MPTKNKSFNNKLLFSSIVTFTVFAFLSFPSFSFAQEFNFDRVKPRSVIQGKNKKVPVDVKRRNKKINNFKRKSSKLKDTYIRDKYDYRTTKRRFDKAKDRFKNKNNLDEKRRDFIKNNLDKVLDRLTSKGESLKNRALLRVDALERIANRVLKKIEIIEERRNVDLSAPKNKINEALSLLAQAKVKIENISINTTVDDVDSLMQEVSSLKSQLKDINKDLLKAHSLIRDALNMLKKAVRKNKSTLPPVRKPERPIKAPIVQEAE